MKKDRLYDILETMKKNLLKAVLSHFGALSDHSALAAGPCFDSNLCVFLRQIFAPVKYQLLNVAFSPKS